ncbi:GntR family transcriptional regulator [Ruegeria aquimaris]|uniref:GntR family transcriptional regulator n=1 Tax=Ruegeria aquimaris TaxID=2984333 RepID=A0ABT3AKX9_9RHOB|nr:GntR family transcriptional regulator [Ruegeria sp. XHP0148]MCV2888796.1 GntR family transcriptional regulator [Ruegeria sp. XHP0148]
MTQPGDKPLSNTQRAVCALRQMIFDGTLAAGSDHLESELADRLGMSRTPVREAALMLEGQGLLELRPRKGVRILPVSPADMREIYDILTELESLAARRAAERRPDDAELARLAQALSDMDTALDRNDLEAWAEADDRFHLELVRLGGNARLSAMVMLMSDQVRRARAVTLFMRPNPVQSNADHRRVYQAIRAGHPCLAGDIHHQHRRTAGDMMVALLERYRLNHI